MTQDQRLAQLLAWLERERGVARAFALRELGVSPATLKRDIAKLRHQQDWAIQWNAEAESWQLDRQAVPGRQMLGLKFSPDEAHALLTMQHLLAQMDVGGLLSKHLRPMAKHLNALVQYDTHGKHVDVGRFLRVAHVGTRRVNLPCFQTVGGALLSRIRLTICHVKRQTGEAITRDVSPQRLIHYRGNWYLDAWCHTKNLLRSFAVDAITSAVALPDQSAIDIPEEALDAEFGEGYGIFAGKNVQWATLRFSADRSRWVSHEIWHPNQRGEFDDQQRWVLAVPYSDDRELVMDILRHVPEVQVLEPKALRDSIMAKLGVGIRTVGAGS